MATETMQTKNASDIDMMDQSLNNNRNLKRSSNLSCELLNTSSTFQLTTPFRNANHSDNGNVNSNSNNNGDNNDTPSRPISTPSIPNTQLRNLHISTPSENIENKEESEELLKNGPKPNDNDCIIKDNHSHITIIENKQLQKVADSFPNKCYNRIQAKNLNKLDHELQSTIDTFLAKKRKKLQQLEAKKREKANANKKLSDKQEKDENDDEEMEDKKANNDQNKDKNKNDTEQAPKEEISNENKLEIIEKAINACKQQLIYYNKLFLNPVPMNLSASNRNHVIMNKTQILTDKKEIKSKIEKIKAKIDERRQKLMHHIQHLNKLRDQTKKIEVKMPQIIRDKIVKNMNYNEQNQNDDQNEKMKIETQEIVAMINNNKKKKFIEMKQKFEELKANEMRLKQRADKLNFNEEQLRKYLELKIKNQNERDDDNDTIMSISNNDTNINRNKHRNVSMESSITVDSTIHTIISPTLLNKHQSKTFQKQLKFGMLRKMDMTQKQRNGVYDHDLNEDL